MSSNDFRCSGSIGVEFDLLGVRSAQELKNCYNLVPFTIHVRKMGEFNTSLMLKNWKISMKSLYIFFFEKSNFSNPVCQLEFEERPHARPHVFPNNEMSGFQSHMNMGVSNKIHRKSKCQVNKLSLLIFHSNFNSIFLVFVIKWQSKLQLLENLVEVVCATFSKYVHSIHIKQQSKWHLTLD